MIRKLARSIREYKWSAILSPITMIGEVYMEVQIPLVLANIVDLGVQQGNITAVLKYGLILVAYALMSLAFGVASAFFAAHAATGFARNLRHDMFYQVQTVQTFDFSSIDKFSTSSIVTRLTSDVANIQMAFQMMIRMAIRCPMMLILATTNAYSISPRLCLVYCVVLPLLGLGLYLLIRMMIRMAIRCPMMLILATTNAYSISPRLCLVYCVVLPLLGLGLYLLIRIVYPIFDRVFRTYDLLGLGLYLLIRIVYPIFDRVFRTYDQLNNVVQENLHGIRVVKSFVREARETEKFTTVSSQIYQDFCKAERTMSFNNLPRSTRISARLSGPCPSITP